MIPDQEKDELWHLLGDSSRVVPSVEFTEQVLDRVRLERTGVESNVVGKRKFLSFPLKVLLPIAACVALGFFLAPQNTAVTDEDSLFAESEGKEMMIPEEFHKEVEISQITYIENLLAEQEVYLLADHDLVALFSE